MINKLDAGTTATLSRLVERLETAHIDELRKATDTSAYVFALQDMLADTEYLQRKIKEALQAYKDGPF